MKLFTEDSIVVSVRNLATARAWYEEKLDCKFVGMGEDDLGPVALLKFKGEPEPTIYMAEPRPGEGRGERPILFTGNVAKAHDTLSSRGIWVGPIQTDRSGLDFFEFRDCDGNSIEVCKER